MNDHLVGKHLTQKEMEANVRAMCKPGISDEDIRHMIRILRYGIGNFGS